VSNCPAVPCPILSLCLCSLLNCLLLFTVTAPPESSMICSNNTPSNKSSRQSVNSEEPPQVFPLSSSHSHKLPPTPPVATHCYRLIAVDINTKLDCNGRFVKHVRCLDYYHKASQNLTTSNESVPTGRCSIDNISVLLYEDW
jgi:hypothetical protein